MRNIGSDLITDPANAAALLFAISPGFDSSKFQLPSLNPINSGHASASLALIGSAGLMFIVTGLPVCSPVPLMDNLLFIVFWLSADIRIL